MREWLKVAAIGIAYFFVFPLTFIVLAFFLGAPR